MGVLMVLYIRQLHSSWLKSVKRLLPRLRVGDSTAHQKMGCAIFSLLRNNIDPHKLCLLGGEEYEVRVADKENTSSLESSTAFAFEFIKDFGIDAWRAAFEIGE
ncbi:hypothetical protein CDAR_31671 [Caerostris darwini]|uniref:Uncharacterized protein n=1 Tax=Caerostris darwini TaxID=1538125 RepID=A0AAV4NSG1_9ARAC|nr:hypothetical protein CDAR_31671 [Caerostris darwini]